MARANAGQSDADRSTNGAPFEWTNTRDMFDRSDARLPVARLAFALAAAGK
jgi:hypothetical protein